MMLARRKPIRRSPLKPRTRRARKNEDPAYLDWIRTQPCVLCVSWGMFQKRITEAAHVGMRGMSQKCSDRETIPLCAEHHRLGPVSHHVLGKKFWAHHGLNREEMIRSFNASYDGSH
jgi:hypothetical protein